MRPGTSGNDMPDLIPALMTLTIILVMLSVSGIIFDEMNREMQESTGVEQVEPAPIDIPPETVAVVLLGAVLVFAVGWWLGGMKYSVGTFGVRRRVTSESLTLYKESCINCEKKHRPGERREWAKEFVLFGRPLKRYEGGVNHYCDRCADPLRLHRSTSN